MSQEEEPVNGLARGLAFGIPAGLLLWAGIIAAVSAVL